MKGDKLSAMIRIAISAAAFEAIGHRLLCAARA
jgi:hypothetical protein